MQAVTRGLRTECKRAHGGHMAECKQAPTDAKRLAVMPSVGFS